MSSNNKYNDSKQTFFEWDAEIGQYASLPSISQTNEINENDDWENADEYNAKKDPFIYRFPKPEFNLHQSYMMLLPIVILSNITGLMHLVIR